MEPTDTTAADDEALTALFDRLLTAWGDGDAEAYGATFTDDVDYVPFDGSRSRGRAAVVASHDDLFRGVLRGSRLVGEVESIRHPTPDVAVLHALASVLMPWRRRLPRRRLSRQTLVAVRTPAGWRFTAFHNSRVRPMAVPAPDAVPSRASHVLARLLPDNRVSRA